ncbi:MAG: diaminopimelate epimerase [Desulfobacteraceae bacterium]|nr:MAG: diaminopimelate epimerase [Desulfobacteraceae bacterium]
MSIIPFVKTTSYGNNFVIVDETEQPALTEFDKPDFAYQATNPNFGVGSDNFLVIQPCTKKVLKTINQERDYWRKLPNSSAADFIFRMFEPDGKEALCCGNGLMCIAELLFRRYGIESTRIMTEIPSMSPKIKIIGTDAESKASWANMGYPRRIPCSLLGKDAIEPYDDAIEFLHNLPVRFRAHDLSPFSHKLSLEISGYLVFTGEPHMVVFTDSGFSIEELRNLMFIRSRTGGAPDSPEKRVAFGSWLIHHIGTSVNRLYGHLFPFGININFVHSDENSEALEYRCFERGIFRETLACGTGAVAVSFVSRRLNRIGQDRIRVLPHRCRWEQPDAEILVFKDKSGWFLYGRPLHLFEGQFLMRRPFLSASSNRSGSEKIASASNRSGRLVALSQP